MSGFASLQKVFAGALADDEPDIETWGMVEGPYSYVITRCQDCGRYTVSAKDRTTPDKGVVVLGGGHGGFDSFDRAERAARRHASLSRQ